MTSEERLRAVRLMGFTERQAAFPGRGSFWLEGMLRAVMEIRGCGPDEARETIEDARLRAQRLAGHD